MVVKLRALDKRKLSLLNVLNKRKFCRHQVLFQLTLNSLLRGKQTKHERFLCKVFVAP